ncbi:transposase [Rhodospirillum sp. A1_3_36]|uniref:transposase n=1 Tax=Rhodospirillum sp. A1_3_36 TaxID=3391666 RepID=UPI0039A6E3C6
MSKQHKQNTTSQALDTIPGFGRLLSLTLALHVDPAQFKDGRHFASWVGLTPKPKSPGGKVRIGGISREGYEGIRHLPVVGAMAVIAGAKRSGKALSPWLTKLLERKPLKLAACALANKMARIAWAIMTTGECYRKPDLQALSAV